MNELEAAIKELHFKNMLVESLLIALEEVQTLSKDKLIIGITKNAIERYELDKLAHSRLIFFK